ncbi:MAG: IS110 family transposase [Chlamydiales bacterium]
MRNYTNKTVYLGMDVHKKTYAVTAICDGQVVKKDTLKADPAILVAYCKKYFIGAKIESAYEAGFCGFYLHRCLKAQGITNIVVDAAGMEVAVGDRVKTDKRDSLKLATHLSVGRLRGIRVPSVEREDYRAVTRLRETFTRQRSRFACQLKSLLFQHGLIRADDKKKISEKWAKVLETMPLSAGLKFAIANYLAQWRQMTAKIKEINRELAVQAQKDGAIEAIYRSVPGIGEVSARVLANELEDTLQFSNEKTLFSYTGLTPSEYSSGEHVRQGHITRHGKPILRKILVQTAWKAIGIDSSLEEIFLRLSTRIGKKRAIIGIARRLIGRIHACFRTGELYRIPSTKNGKAEEKSVAVQESQLANVTP